MKKPLIYIVSGLIIIGVAAAAYFGVVRNENIPKNTPQTSQSAASEDSTDATASETETVSTTETTESTETTETTKQKTTAAESTEFIKTAYFYLFDEKNTACYVFSFNGKGRADLAVFDESNIVYEDPQYFEGFASYKVSGNKIEITKLPSTVPMSSITLTAKDGILYSDKTELESHRDLKLSYAVNFSNK